MDKKQWQDAAAGLHNINSALGEGYIVEVNSKKFYKEIAERTMYKCIDCEKDTHYSHVKVFDLNCPMFEGIVTGEKTNKVWICPNCKNDCKLKDTVITMEETVQPYYRAVVPTAPVKQMGLQNRYNFEHEFRVWFHNFLEELQHQLAKYRIEYVKMTGHEMADTGYQHKGDDE